MLNTLRTAAAHVARLYTLYAPVHWGKRAIIEGHGVFEALHRLPDAQVVSTYVGPRFAIHMPDMIQRALFFCGVWEPTITAWMQHRLKPGDTFIDVGGNVGYHSCVAALCVERSGHVIAMEPSPSIGLLFTNNIELNGFSNVRLEACAVSDRESTLQVLRGSPNALGTTRTSRAHSEFAEATVPAKRLNDIVPHDLLYNARLVKIDIEGAESHAIRGIADELGRFHEHTEWIIEMSPGQAEDADAYMRQQLEPFERVGYRAFALENHYATDWYVRHARRLTSTEPQALLRSLPHSFAAVEQIDVLLTRDPDLQGTSWSPLPFV